MSRCLDIPAQNWQSSDEARKSWDIVPEPQGHPQTPSRRAVRTVQLAVEIVGVEGAGELKDGVPPVQPGLLLPPV